MIASLVMQNLQPQLQTTHLCLKSLTDDDFEPELHQKGVDIKIGLDLAWISFNKIAEKVIFVTGDSDFVPAIKTARRNGIFVYLVSLNHMIRPELAENCDISMNKSIKDLDCI